MSRTASSSASISEQLAQAGGRIKRKPGRPAVMREVQAEDFSHAKPDQLLTQFWDYTKLTYAMVAAMLVSTLGAEKAEPVTVGELKDAVVTAGGLQKAHGRNIKREIVAQDLGISVPDGFTPTFDLYLQAAKIRPDNNDTRAAAREVLAAIRKKMRKLQAGETPPVTVAAAA